MKNNTRWMNFFDAHLNKYHSLLEYAAEHWQYHAPMFHHLRQVIPAPARLLEIGCGLGFSAIYLHGCGYEITAVDNAPVSFSFGKNWQEFCDNYLTPERVAIAKEHIADVRDWLGGYPYEDAKIKQVIRFARRTLQLELINIGTGEANTEYLFMKRRG